MEDGGLSEQMKGQSRVNVIGTGFVWAVTAMLIALALAEMAFGWIVNREAGYE